jgi:CheY-like chemotaxis protein
VTTHVLLVEDNALVIGALRLLLEETGHTVSAASTVADAARAIRTEHPDIVLLDVTLEREDGLDLLAELRRAGDPLPVTIAVTGHDEPEVRDRCRRAGCRDVLLKPIDTRMLPKQIAGWLT